MLLQLKSFLRKCALPRHKKHCPHMAVAVKCWAPLRAWCRVLRGRLSVSYTSEPAQDGLETRSRFETLVLTLDESEDAISPRTRAKIRDAVELVLLALQTAPQDAWEQVVRVLCWTQDFYPANHLPTELETRLCVRHVAYGTFQYDTLDVFASMWATGARSKSYQRTRRWILDNAQSDCVLTSLKPVPLTLEVTPTLTDMARGSTRYLERTAKVVQTLQASSASSTALRLDGIALNLRALDVDASGLSALRKLQQTGVRVDSLAFSPTRPHLAKPDGAFVAMLNDAANPIQRLALDNSSGLAPASVWEALRHARALKDVEIAQSAKGSLAERRLVLQWQAFALLDARSPTPIERVRFTEGSLSRDDIHAMNEVLASENPAQLLGLQEEDAKCERPREKRLKFLQLMTSPASDDETTEALQLIGAVGRHLETLAWSVDRCVLKQSHLGALFTVCPQLRRLRLQRAQLQEIDGMLVHYQAGLCRRLESLTLEDSVVLDRPSLLRFLAACNEPRSAVHRTLKDFAYDNYLHESVLAELLPLVEQNASLRYIGLRVTAFGMARHREQLKQLHLAPLAQQHAPLAIESKVAFMGATLGALNSDVCHHIFGFAGEPVRRKVMCFVYDWVRLPNRFEL